MDCDRREVGTMKSLTGINLTGISLTGINGYDWSRFLPVLAVGLAAWIIWAAGGCEAAPAPVNTSRDSLGISIVESVAPLWTEADAWQIDDEPVVDLAATGSGDMHIFFQVRDFLRTPDGHLAVADYASQQIRLYDADGRFLRAFGGSGDGPGEFRSLFHLVLTPRGTILALDFRPGGSGAEFDVDSGLVGTFRIPSGAYPVRHTVPTDVVWGFDAGYTMESEGMAQGLQRTPGTIVRMSADRVSANSVASVPGMEHIIAPEGDLIPLMPRETLVVPGSDGNVVVGLADALEYQILDGQTGELRRIARILGVSLALTAEEIDRERQVRLGPDPSPFTRSLVDGLPDPTGKPAYQSMIVDAEGNVWAGEYLGLARRDEPQKWYVWDAGGVWLGTVETPARFELMRVGVGEVLGVWRDVNDVEHPWVLGVGGG